MLSSEEEVWKAVTENTLLPTDAAAARRGVIIAGHQGELDDNRRQTMTSGRKTLGSYVEEKEWKGVVKGDRSRRVTVELPRSHRALVEACLRAFGLEEPVRLYVNGSMVATPSNHSSIRDDDVIVVVDRRGKTVDLQTTYCVDFAEGGPSGPFSPRAGLEQAPRSGSQLTLGQAVGPTGVSEYEARYAKWPTPTFERPRRSAAECSRDNALVSERTAVFEARTHYSEQYVAHGPAVREKVVKPRDHGYLTSEDDSRAFESTSRRDFGAPPRRNEDEDDEPFFRRRSVHDQSEPRRPCPFEGTTQSRADYVAHPVEKRPVVDARRSHDARLGVHTGPFEGRSEYAERYRRWPLEERQRPTPAPGRPVSRGAFDGLTVQRRDFGPPPPSDYPPAAKDARAARDASLRGHVELAHAGVTTAYRTGKHDFQHPGPDFFRNEALYYHQDRARVHLEPEEGRF